MKITQARERQCQFGTDHGGGTVIHLDEPIRPADWLELVVIVGVGLACVVVTVGVWL